MNYSIDRILQVVNSKYMLVYVAAKRAAQMDETKHYQMKEKEYKSKKSLDKALEEVQNGLIHVN